MEEGRWLNIDGNVNLNEDIASRILASDKGTKKAVDGREYIAVLNQCDDEKIMECAKAITRTLEEKYHIKAVCCCLK